MPPLLDPARYPRASSYLATLPGGFDAYPTCLTTAEYSMPVRDEFPELILDPAISEDIRRRFTNPWRAGGWISTVETVTLFLMARDRIFETDEEFLAWNFRLSVRLFDSPFYKAVMFVATPRMLIRGLAWRWKRFHRGTELATEGTDSPRKIVLTFPPNLFEPTLLMAIGAAMRGAIGCAGGRNVRCELLHQQRERAEFALAWDARPGPNTVVASEPDAPGNEGPPAMQHREVQFAGGMAHVVRNPLSASQALLQGAIGPTRDTHGAALAGMQEALAGLARAAVALPAEQAGDVRLLLGKVMEHATELDEALSGVQRANGRALQAVEHILAYSQFAANPARPIQHVRMRRRVEQLMEELSTELAAHHVEVSRVLADVVIEHVAPDDIQVACRNVLRNALDALIACDDARSLRLDVLLDARGGRAVLLVRDNGEGTADRTRIFEPFYTTRPGTHMGLGLTLARRIVDMHGGSIRCQSVVNEGTTMALVIPTQCKRQG